MTSPVYSRIVGTGSYVPDRCLTNQDLVDVLDRRGIQTSDEWIVTRTGIRSRHFVDPGVNTSDLAYAAACLALEMAEIDKQSVDLIVVATTTPDYVFPSTACLLQNKLCIRNHGMAFDTQAVCTGFIYGLAIADQLIRSRMASTALVVGAETISRLLNFDDRTTCVLFGDGAGAVILRASDQAGVLSSALHADGQYVSLLCVPGHVYGGQAQLQMEGQAVFKLAVNVLEQVAREALNKAQLTVDQIDWLIPHQANIRIMQSTCRKLGVSSERMVVSLDKYGNTSAASIPMALDEAVRDKRIQPGHVLLMEGVGGGLTWGANAVVF